MDSILATRAEKLGDLVRQARKYAGRSVKDCAEVLHLSKKGFKEIEKGQTAVSLPQLEALALYLKIPLSFFWGSTTLATEPEINYENYVALRQRVIGVLLRQLRMQARQTEDEVSTAVDIDTTTLASYEKGDQPVPYLEMEQLCHHFGASVDHFVDKQYGPLNKHEKEHRLLAHFRSMEPDTQAFLINPHNDSFIETARNLSEMDVARLRQIAESILDITY